MGMQAAYMQVDTATLDRLKQTPPDELADAVDQLESDGAPTVYLDKAWDGLHFLLTGVSASAPIEHNRLSEAVVGVRTFDAEEFVACTELAELPEIVTALDGVQLDAVFDGLDFAAFARADIYPAIWTETPADLVAELTRAFRDLITVHRACAAAGHHLIVSIL